MTELLPFIGVAMIAGAIGVWIGDALSYRQARILHLRLLDAVINQPPPDIRALQTGYFRAIDAMAAALDDLTEEDRTR